MCPRFVSIKQTPSDPAHLHRLPLVDDAYIVFHWHLNGFLRFSNNKFMQWIPIAPLLQSVCVINLSRKTFLQLFQLIWSSVRACVCVYLRANFAEASVELVALRMSIVYMCSILIVWLFGGEVSTELLPLHHPHHPSTTIYRHRTLTFKCSDCYLRIHQWPLQFNPKLFHCDWLRILNLIELH